MTRKEFAVDSMAEGEILVRGTLDPMEALKLLFEDGMFCAEIHDMLGGVARTGKYWHEASQTRVEGLVDPDAVGAFADWCHGKLRDARSGYYRKVNCLESSYGAGEGWRWALHEAPGPGRGAFKAVEFL